MERLTTVRLHGSLAQRFGREFRFSISSPRQAVLALARQIPAFRDALRAPGARFRVLAGTTHVTEAILDGPVGGGEMIRIIPVVQAAKDGFGQILVGAALIGLAATPWAAGLGALGTAVQGMGVSMVLGGVAQILAGSPDAPLAPSEPSGRDPNYLFDGAVNTVAQGQCVPVCYGGPIRVGSARISAGSSPETWAPLNSTNVRGQKSGDGDATPWAWSIDPELTGAGDDSV